MLGDVSKAAGGRIIMIASTSGLKGYAYTGAYAAAKHGVIGLTRTLALELAQTGATAMRSARGLPIPIWSSVRSTM